MSLSLAIVLSMLIALVAGALLLLYWALVYRPHPRIEGHLRAPGLHDTVEVLRDRWGVPHIYAVDEHDLWFAQGYVQAQDRLWQMEQFRRVAAGRISEAVGEEGLPIDRWARVLGLRRAAETQVADLDADARNVLECYAAGVNAYLEQNRNRLPLEFTLLGVRPEPWDLADTLGIGLLLGWALSSNWQEELTRVTMYTRLGPERAAELLPDEAIENPGVLGGAPLNDLSEQLLTAFRGLSDYLGLLAPGQGSNNWVVSGERTITGKPLLANDPHLAVTMPGLWHIAHLESREGGTRLIGASMPGAPGVMIGHNDAIAWGATAAFADASDLYVEKRHPQDATRFLFRETWEQAEVREEAIKVRGRAEPVIQKVTVTRHGPLLNDLLAEHEANFPALTLRWAGLEPRTAVNGFVGMMRAQNWEEFWGAAARLTVPSLSFVYADRSGNIGYIAGGLVPIRAQGYGLVPAPGHTGSHEWVSFIPPAELPRSFNPGDGKLLSANNRITPADYPHWWGVDMYPGYRARRIAELIDSRPRLSTRDFQAMQTDTYSYLGRAIAPYFTLIDPKDPWERRAQKALLEWNYRMDADSMAALIFEMVVHHLLDLVFADKLGPAANDYFHIPRLREMGGAGFSQQAQAKLVELLQHEQSWWFGESATGRPRTREDLLSLALQRAVGTAKSEISDDARRWQWGRIHQVLWRHPLGVIRPLRGLLNRGPFPVGGSGATINAQVFEQALPPRTVTVAPTFRMIVDVANWDRSTFITCPGQSGAPGHRFYSNLMYIWLEGDMIPMSFSRQKVEQSDPLYRLELRPI